MTDPAQFAGRTPTRNRSLNPNRIVGPRGSVRDHIPASLFSKFLAVYCDAFQAIGHDINANARSRWNLHRSICCNLE